MAEPPIAAPAGVLAELTMATPDATWQALQSIVGGPATLAPSTIGGLLVVQGGDPSLASLLDTTQPVFAVVAGELDAPHVVFCAHAKAGRTPALKAGLAESDTAKFKASGSEQSIEVLEPRGAGSRVIGLAHGEFVLFASSRADLGNYGPYAYRTLPTKAVAPHGVAVTVGRDALAGPAKVWLGKKADSMHASLAGFDDELRKDHAGRAPDFGDPKPLIAILDRWASGVQAAVGDMDHASLELDVAATSVSLTLSLAPGSSAGPARELVASMRPGDLAPLLDAPDGAMLTVLARSDAAERTANAQAVGSTLLSVADTRLPAAAGKRLSGALDTLAAARGDYFLASLDVRPATHSLTVTTHVSDEAKALGAVDALTDVAFAPPFYGALQSSLSLKTKQASQQELPPLGKGRLVAFTRDGEDALGPSLQLGYGAKGGLLVAVVAKDAPAAIASAAAPAHKLASDALVTSALGRLGHDCSFGAVLAPGAIAGSSDPVIIGWGKHGEGAFLSLEAGGKAARLLLTQIATGL